jgi:hypothetical protein
VAIHRSANGKSISVGIEEVCFVKQARLMDGWAEVCCAGARAPAHPPPCRLTLALPLARQIVGLLSVQRLSPIVDQFSVGLDNMPAAQAAMVVRGLRKLRLRTDTAEGIAVAGGILEGLLARFNLKFGPFSDKRKPVKVAAAPRAASCTSADGDARGVADSTLLRARSRRFCIRWASSRRSPRSPTAASGTGCCRTCTAAPSRGARARRSAGAPWLACPLACPSAGAEAAMGWLPPRRASGAPLLTAATCAADHELFLQNFRDVLQFLISVFKQGDNRCVALVCIQVQHAVPASLAQEALTRHCAQRLCEVYLALHAQNKETTEEASLRAGPAR